jgi:thiamine-monophosphate kinase
LVAVNGEFELIARLTAALAAPGGRVRVGVGDDAAVTVPGGATATTVDSFVDGVHFRRGTSPLRSVGAKALAATLSDLAAMGAQPGEAYVALAVPDDLTAADCELIYEGIRAVADDTATAIAGGDVTRSPVLSLAVTAVGHVAEPDALVRRGGAEPGQLVVVTGSLGGAAAGLLLLDRPELARAVDEATAEVLTARHREPRPRLAEGAALARAGATAMIDVSDGLGADAGHVATASGTSIVIDLASLPVAAGVAEVAAAGGADPLDLAAAGGEDYELLACLPPERLAEAEAAVAAGAGLTRIGEVRAGAGIELRDPKGGIRSPTGFDHLAGR